MILPLIDGEIEIERDDLWTLTACLTQHRKIVWAVSSRRGGPREAYFAVAA
jgi:hypothetical protein